jgi:leader peptidase (prepilin peptidase)/N-methyltransferase
MTPDWLPLAAAPFVGSFAGVLVRRLPRGQPVVLARSRCEGCGAALGAAELVPLLGYAWQRGQCRRCGGRIAPFHPAIELGALIVAAWAVAADQAGLRLWFDCALGWTLLALAWIDAEWLVLPDPLTLPLVLAGLAATALLDPADLAAHAAAAALGWLSFALIARAFRALRGREGLGAGDAKLLAAAGTWVGPERLADVVLLAALLGLAWALAGRLRQGPDAIRGELPFGPHLALAMWIVRLHL